MTACLKSVVKIARMSSCDDSGDIKRGVFTWHGKDSARAMIQSIYGLLSYPPADSLGVILSQNAQESNPIAFVDDPNNRIKLDAEGECGLGNYLTKATIIHKENGDTECNTPKSFIIDAKESIILRVGGVSLTVTDSSVTVTGGVLNVESGLSVYNSGADISGVSLNVTGGDITTDQDVTASGISLNSHTHGGVVAGGDETGVPI